MLRYLFAVLLMLAAGAHAGSFAMYRAGPMIFHLSDSNLSDGRAAAYSFSSTVVNDVVLPVPSGPLGDWGGYVHSGSWVEPDRQAKWYADPTRMEAVSQMEAVQVGGVGGGSWVEYGVWLAPHSRLDITAPVWMEWISEETSQTGTSFTIQFTPRGGYPYQSAGTASYSGGGRSGEKYRLIKLSLQSGADQLYGQLSIRGAAGIHYNALVPEPSTWAFMLVGLAAMAGLRQRIFRT